jgi:anti-sigma-K factor RskA
MSSIARNRALDLVRRNRETTPLEHALLSITIEPEGGSPYETPTGQVVYEGTWLREPLNKYRGKGVWGKGCTSCSS